MFSNFQVTKQNLSESDVACVERNTPGDVSRCIMLLRFVRPLSGQSSGVCNKPSPDWMTRYVCNNSKLPGSTQLRSPRSFRMQITGKWRRAFISGGPPPPANSVLKPTPATRTWYRARLYRERHFKWKCERVASERRGLPARTSKKHDPSRKAPPESTRVAGIQFIRA